MQRTGSDHLPGLKTLLVIEKAIMNSEEHPTRMQLYRSLPTRKEYQTFKAALEYLEAHGTIVFNSKVIVYTGGDNEKLRRLMETRLRI